MANPCDKGRSQMCVTCTYFTRAVQYILNATLIRKLQSTSFCLDRVAEELFIFYISCRLLSNLTFVPVSTEVNNKQVIVPSPSHHQGRSPSDTMHPIFALSLTELTQDIIHCVQGLIHSLWRLCRAWLGLASLLKGLSTSHTCSL